MGEKKKSLPDNLFKSHELSDEDVNFTLTGLGPKEKFAGKVLKSLKQKIAESREELRTLEEEIGKKQERAEEIKDEILEEAREQADSIRREAEEEAERIRSSEEEVVEEARQQGFEEGLQQGKQEARERTAGLLEGAREILEEAKRERDAYLAEQKNQLVKLSALMAEQIVRETVELREDVARKVVSDALDEIRDVQEITIVLNPTDYESVQGVISDFQNQHPSLEEITLSEDSRMNPGGCRIHTSFGDIDGTLQGQIEHLTRHLLDSA